jgi:phosphatidylglycerol:prolipoprotein diacylglycerol transferase
MCPILFKIGPLSLYSYGIMVALGFAVAIAFIYRRAAEFGLDAEKVIDYAILVLITGLSGARLAYVLLNYGYYSARPAEIFNISKGGLVWYGGFIAAALMSVWFVRVKRLDFWSASDLVAPYIALAQALGRIGCFLNGCCYGSEAPASYPAGVIFPEDMVLRHPTQLYSASALLLIFVALRLWQDRRHFDGEIFLAYCMLYADKRFIVEFLRGDNPKLFLSLTVSQIVSVILFSAAAGLFMYRSHIWKTGRSTE